MSRREENEEEKFIFKVLISKQFIKTRLLLDSVVGRVLVLTSEFSYFSYMTAREHDI